MVTAPAAPTDRAVLAAHEVHKVYGSGTHALRGVSLAIRAGSVHGLIGANGAGKSTLIKVLCGAEEATSGAVTWRGEQVRWTAPGQALAAGLSAVQQHTPLVGTLSVLDNVFLGHRDSRLWNRERRLAELAALLDRVGYRIDPDAPVAALSVGARQMIAILQALARDPALILLDEPTASLSSSERELLFAVVRRLRDQGTTFVFVSHFLDEILELTDRLTVLRDGAVVLDAGTADVGEQDLVTAMVGERLHRVEERPADRAGPADLAGPAQGAAADVLRVDDLSSPERFGPVSLRVGAGEIVGLAGLLGSGRTELLEAVFGADPLARGTVRVADRPLHRRSPRAAVRAGLALVPGDRNRQGALPAWSIRDNVTLPYLPRLSWRHLVPRLREEQQLADRALEDLGIVAPSADALVGELSGGNAQKVVFAKWLYGPARVFLLDEPSAGVDVAAKADIIQLIRGLADRGHGVLMASSEFEELLGVCDRILVLRRGRVTAERAAAATDLHELTALASGLA